MNQYQKWPEENYPKKCPVHNCYVFHPTNSPNFIPTQKTFVVQKKPQIIQIKNLNNNPQYNSYTNYNQTDPNILLRQYQSPDGVLRGYNNNYSFYVSGSSKVKSNVTINNQINNYTTQTMGQYPMKINGNNPSYLILEKEPIYYNYNTNYNTNNYNQMPNKNVNIQQRVYQAPKIEKRTVKRIIDKEPITQKNSKLSQVQNNIKRNINTVKQKEMFKKINTNNNNYAKYNRYQISNKKNISPIIPRKGQYQQLPQQKKSNKSISYEQRPYQYRVYTEQNDYQPYGEYSYNNYNNYPNYNYPMANNQREYTSRTELPEQRGYNNYEYEQEDYEEEDNEDEDDIYEVPVQNNTNNNNTNMNIKRGYYPERPFIRINAQPNRKKYGVYTQTLAMNSNYYNDEYEYDPNNGRYITENNGNYYSQPKYVAENYSKRYTKQDKEFTPFQKSLRNIQLNNEEIEIENNQRSNSRVKIRTSRANNHRLYISNNNRSYPRRNYRTYTEQNAYRNDYILQDLEDEDYEYVNKYKYNNNNQKVQKNNYNNEEEIENDDDSDNNDGEKMYDNDKLIKANEDNFKIVQKKGNKENYDFLNNEDEIPHDKDEIPPKRKMKNIETEINEKYYDNQGNYLGEKKIITTKQVPIDEDNINIQQEGDNEEEDQEQEEVEEYESENANYVDSNENEEYVPYKSSNKKFEKRGKKISNNSDKKLERPSKYKSYFGDSSNNVYYESKGDSKDLNQERKKLNINTKVINNQDIQIRNSQLGIQSENLCVPAESNHHDDENEEKESDDGTENDNDEKEADEQQIEENEIFDDDNDGQVNENNNEINEEKNDIINNNKNEQENEELNNLHEENQEENNLQNQEYENEMQYGNEEQMNNDKEIINENNNINNGEEQNLQYNDNEDVEQENIPNENGEEEYLGEEYKENGEKMDDIENENINNHDENNNELENNEEEGVEEEENGNYDIES